MPPFAFLAIPLVVLILGTGLLVLYYREAHDGQRQVSSPGDPSGVAPLLRHQRDAGWNSGTTGDLRR